MLYLLERQARTRSVTPRNGDGVSWRVVLDSPRFRVIQGGYSFTATRVLYGSLRLTQLISSFIALLVIYVDGYCVIQYTCVIYGMIEKVSKNS